MAEGAGEVPLIVKAAIQGDLAHGLGGGLQASAGHEEAHAQQVVARGGLEEFLEQTAELAHGEMAAEGEVRQLHTVRS